MAATLFLVGGLGVAGAAGVLLRPTGSPEAVPAPTTPVPLLPSSTTATIVVSPTTAPTTVAATTTAAPIATIAPVVPTTTVAPRSFGPDGWWRSAVLATTLQGTVEVWTAAGQVASVDGCAATAHCSVAIAVLLADSVVVQRYDDRGASLVRLPLAGGDAVVLPAGGLVDGITAGPDGASVWWLERPPVGGFGGSVHRWPAADRPVELDQVFGLAPGPGGRTIGYLRPPRYADDGRTMLERARVVVRDFSTGDERGVELPDGAFATSLAWAPAGDRLLVQLLDEAIVVDVPAAGGLRLGRPLPFVAACIDTDDRVLGVRRVGAAPTMTHELGEADLRTGRATSWGGAVVSDGTMTCRGDGAMVLATWAADGTTTELRVRRADGRDTLLGRGYAIVAGPRGRLSFSSMQCGGEGA